MKQNIDISFSTTYKFEKGSKYLIILPVIRNADVVTAALQKFLGDDIQVFVIAVKDVTSVKIAELMGGEA